MIFPGEILPRDQDWEGVTVGPEPVYGSQLVANGFIDFEARLVIGGDDQGRFG